VKTFWQRAGVWALLSIGLASVCFGQNQTVPEVDASSGSMALTLVAGAMLWVQQVRRRSR